MRQTVDIISGFFSFRVLESFGRKVIKFYQDLQSAPEVPNGVEILYPHLDAGAWKAITRFYQTFYNDTGRRVFIIGINPGRFGAGTTGIPFTDPIRLKDALGISHEFVLRSELSSRFIYHMIEAYGGVKKFYQQCYFTSVSPFGFTRFGKNLNYYDLKELQDTWESYMVSALKAQIAIGACPQAVSLGQGKNHQYLHYLNNKYNLFKEVHPLPHPRWIMQYRLKKIDHFTELYCNNLKKFICTGII